MLKCLLHCKDHLKSQHKSINFFGGIYITVFFVVISNFNIVYWICKEYNVRHHIVRMMTFEKASLTKNSHTNAYNEEV